LQRVDGRIEADHAFAEFDVAVHQCAYRIGDLALDESAHLGDLAGDLLQVGVEGLGGVVDSGRGDVGHLYYPKRPVM
jgi:hypothetical protein